MKVTALYIYPIKSLGGISVQQARLTTRGLAHDRRFMLTTPAGKFLTQRSKADMALLKTKIEGNQLTVWNSHSPKQSITFPLTPTRFSKEQPVTIWGDICIGSVMSESINQWFSEQLNMACQLVYMSEQAQRPIEEKYRKEGEVVSFADGYPFLVLGQRSLDDLNERLAQPVPADRFRANILFSDGQAFEEDNWTYFTIAQQLFRGTKPCARCAVPNINQDTAKMEKEPNYTLATFRKFNKKIYVGQNACWEGTLSEGDEIIRVGDEIKRKNEE